jgi:hypothetical protein
VEFAVPLTARLSKLFYDRFGDEVVGELVDWLNSADADYRTALREQNESNFTRFDAKLEQRLASRLSDSSGSWRDSSSTWPHSNSA